MNVPLFYQMTACGYKNNHERLHHLPLINELRWHSLVNPSTVGLIITGSNITHNTAHHILMAENEHRLDLSLIKHTWWCHGVPWQASYNEYLRERWSSYYKTPLQPVWRDYFTSYRNSNEPTESAFWIKSQLPILLTWFNLNPSMDK